jgi:hypothetical protein
MQPLHVQPSRIVSSYSPRRLQLHTSTTAFYHTPYQPHITADVKRSAWNTPILCERKTFNNQLPTPRPTHRVAPSPKSLTDTRLPPLEQPCLTNDLDPFGEPVDWHQATNSSGSSHTTRNLPLLEPEPAELDEPFASPSSNANLAMSSISRYSMSATSSSRKPSSRPKCSPCHGTRCYLRTRRQASEAGGNRALERVQELRARQKEDVKKSSFTKHSNRPNVRMMNGALYPISNTTDSA